MISKLKSLGPGLLYAGAAIGVSHIVQSTRAGAEYGYAFILLILIAHVVKYPFFVVGPRYTNLSGENLIAGYAKLSKYSLWLVLALTVATMFSIQAAVTVVTAGLAEKMFQLGWEAWQWSTVLLILCGAIITIGRFNVLDNLMKVIMVVLSISTVLAVALSFKASPDAVKGFENVFSFSRAEDMEFLIAFVGWMPAPMDIAIWHSIWTAAKYTSRGKNDLQSENFDFKVGFYGTAFLAICFLILGSNMLYKTGIPLEVTAGKYAAQLVDLYTTSLGSWSYLIILIAAFTTMFSTTLTCFDAIPRVMKSIFTEMPSSAVKPLANKSLWLAVLGFGAIVILGFFVDNMKQMVTFATVISFLTAPLLAYLSFTLVKRSKFAQKIWSDNERRLAFAGLIFLSVFSIYYIIQWL